MIDTLYAMRCGYDDRQEECDIPEGVTTCAIHHDTVLSRIPAFFGGQATLKRHGREQ